MNQVLNENYPEDIEGDTDMSGGIYVVGPGVYVCLFCPPHVFIGALCRGKQLLFQFREVDEDLATFANVYDILRACGWYALLCFITFTLAYY